jgi:predicted HicB family RNase H-like nuclease
VLTPTAEKFQDVFHRAQSLFEKDPDWVTFFREVLGVEGVVRRAFPSLEELTAFERSSEYDQIQNWIVKLREKRSASDTESEPTRVITVRLPRSLHEYLKIEAHDLHTSMNKLCISKLLQVIDEDKIPAERAATNSRRKRGESTPVQQLGQGQPLAQVAAG